MQQKLLECHVQSYADLFDARWYSTPFDVTHVYDDVTHVYDDARWYSTPFDDQKRPTNEQKRPTNEQKRPTNEQKRPTNEQMRPTNEQKRPTWRRSERCSELPSTQAVIRAVSLR